MRSPTRTRLGLLAAIPLGAALLVGTGQLPSAPDADTAPDGRSGGGTAPPAALTAASLQPFGSCEGLLDRVKADALASVGPFGIGMDAGWGWRGVALDAAGGQPDTLSGMAAAPAERAASAAGGEFSVTNLQEAGVDEPDIVKTDGRRIVAVAGDRLHLLDVASGTVTRVGSVRLGESWGHELFLSGDRVLVLSRASIGTLRGSVVDDSFGWDMRAPDETTLITTVTLAGADAPAVSSTLELEGRYVSARLIDGLARVVVHSPPPLRFAHPDGDTEASQSRATERNRELIEQSTAADWLPTFALEDQAGGQTATSRGSLVSCADVFAPQESAGVGTLSIVTIDPADPAAHETVSILANGETVYASTDSVYVATTDWTDQRALAEGRPIDMERQTTRIHRFDVSSGEKARYTASGEVRGHLLNQFSMSEHEGDLRVATTDGSAGWLGDDRGPSSESYVTVLREDDGELVRIGRVDGLGRGERIYAVRFLGDLGYVVTFRETDPLYVVDLADPTRPALRGELKIPGYSSYLHPMGEGLLIGVGQDATLSGQTRGTQISILDVSDPTGPKRLHQHTLEGGSSEAEYDHHAFLYWPETGQLVLPVESWEQRPSGAEKLTTGAAVFAVSDTAGIDRAGQISHQGRGSDAAVGSEDRWEEDWMARIRRSLVIGDRLYTMSDRGLLVSDLETLADVDWLGF